MGKLQGTGLLKMTLKWAYFIMRNTTIFSCATELVRNLKICPVPAPPLFVLNSGHRHPTRRIGTRGQARPGLSALLRAEYLLQ